MDNTYPRKKQWMLTYVSSVREFLGRVGAKSWVLAGLVLLAMGEIGLIKFGPDGREAMAAVEAALEAGKRPHWEDLADMGLHFAGWINLAILVSLMVTRSWWMRALPVKQERQLAKGVGGLSWRWVWVLLAVGGFAFYYAESSFAKKGLWWDEIWALKQASHGQWREAKNSPSELVFAPTSWKRCAFYYPKPTNHALQSLLQKATLTAWQKLTGVAPHEVEEIIVRLPSLIASGVAVVLMLRTVGAMGGVFAMGLILAIHPWHLRYGVDARAYPLIVPLVLASLLAAQRVIGSGGRSIPAWLGLTVALALWAYSFMPAWAAIGLMFWVLAYFLCRGEECWRDKITVFLRLSVAYGFVLMLWVQLFLPNFVQIKHWFEPGDTPHLVDSRVFASTNSNIFFGMEWERSDAETVEAEKLTSVEQVAGSSEAALGLMVLAALLTGVGFAVACYRAPVAAMLMAAVGLGVLFYMAVTKVAGTNFYPRFAMPLLPITVLCWAMIPLIFNQALLRMGLATILAVGFFAITGEQREVLRTLPYKPMKEIAAYLKDYPVAGKLGTRPRVLGFGLGREALIAYYPQMISTSDVHLLRQTMEQCRMGGQDLLVVKGYASFNQSVVKEGFELITDANVFEELKGWPGLESNFYFRIYRLRHSLN
jgi:hypothetical protein